jgi:hypothetical protein
MEMDPAIKSRGVKGVWLLHLFDVPLLDSGIQENVVWEKVCEK